VRDKRSALGPYALIEAGTDLRGPAPERRGASPHWKLRMKPLMIGGIVVAVLGVLALTRGISYPSHRSMMRVGGLEASIDEQRDIPVWVGIVAVAGGAVLIGAGLRTRKA
jgi:drug/metabolite transporter (DMT)-like permease